LARQSPDRANNTNFVETVARELGWRMRAPDIQAALPRLSGWWPDHGLGIRSTQPQAIEVMAEAARLRVGGPQLIWQLAESVTQLFAAFERAADATARDFSDFRDR
jgi:hypothetical protein